MHRTNLQRYCYSYLGNIDIPDDFIDFVAALGGRTCHFLDKDQVYTTLRLKDILSNGMRHLQGFKKEMGLGQRVVKMKHGTRKDLKNYMYNWAYFYICSLHIIKIVVSCGNSASFNACSPPFVINALYSQLPPFSVALA